MELLVNGIRFRDGRNNDRAAFVLEHLINAGTMGQPKGKRVKAEGLLGRPKMADIADALMGYQGRKLDPDAAKKRAAARTERILAKHEINKAKREKNKE